MPKKNQQKWLTDQVSGDWKDKDTIIESVLVQCLFHYVEHELEGVIPDRGYYDDDLLAGHVSLDYVEKSYVYYDAIRRAYRYFKDERKKLEKEMDEAFDVGNIFHGVKLEKDIYDRDTDMLSVVVKYRGYMWT